MNAATIQLIINSLTTLMGIGGSSTGNNSMSTLMPMIMMMMLMGNTGSSTTGTSGTNSISSMMPMIMMMMMLMTNNQTPSAAATVKPADQAKLLNDLKGHIDTYLDTLTDVLK